MKRFYENCRKKTLSVTKNCSHRLSEEYRNESAERLKGMNMNYLKLVSGCFHKKWLYKSFFSQKGISRHVVRKIN